MDTMGNSHDSRTASANEPASATVTPDQVSNQHTPGPWVYESGPHGDPDFEDCDFLIAEARDRGEVVGTVVGPIRLGTSEANARLIAAAPDLLAALKEVNAALGDERIADVWPTTPDWYPRVLGAIAKAECR